MKLHAEISSSYIGRHRTSDKRKQLPLHENPFHDRYFRIQSRVSAENIVRDLLRRSFFSLFRQKTCTPPLKTLKSCNTGPFFDFHFLCEQKKTNVDLSAHTIISRL